MLIVSNIELLLNYCVRFYDRQFITRENANKDTLAKFEKIMNDYFQSDKPQNIGLPSVQYCADQLHLSANYLGDLIKRKRVNLRRSKSSYILSIWQKRKCSIPAVPSVRSLMN